VKREWNMRRRGWGGGGGSQEEQEEEGHEGQGEFRGLGAGGVYLEGYLEGKTGCKLVSDAQVGI